MLIMTFGWRHSKLDQISRIEKGFIELGHEITNRNPDFLYSNNPTYEDILEFSRKNPNSKIILNILDVATHIPNYPFDLLYNQLLRANTITSISYDTKNKLLAKLGLNSEVVYNPLKITYRKPEIKKDIFAIFCGRLTDSNKRFHLVVETLQKLGKQPEDLIVCGPEQPYWGTYKGIVTDEELNDLYNRAKYYICTTKDNAGIQLPILEAQFAACIPLQCNDNTCAYEFTPDFLADPNPEALATKIVEIEKTGRVEISQELMKSAPLRYKNLHYKSVAQKILEVYAKIA